MGWGLPLPPAAAIPPVNTSAAPTVAASTPVLTTSLKQPARPGDKAIDVASHTGVEAGMTVTIGAGNGSGSGSGEGGAGSGAGETRVVTGLGSILLDRPLERLHGAGTVVSVYQQPPSARPTIGASGGPPGGAGDRMPPLTPIPTTAAALATDTTRGPSPSITTPFAASDISLSSPGQGGRGVGSGKDYEEWADGPSASSALGLLPYAHKQQEVGLRACFSACLCSRRRSHASTHQFPSSCLRGPVCVCMCCYVRRRPNWGHWSKRWPPSPAPARTRTPSPRPSTLLRPRIRVDGYVMSLALLFMMPRD